MYCSSVYCCLVSVLDGSLVLIEKQTVVSIDFINFLDYLKMYIVHVVPCLKPGSHWRHNDLSTYRHIDINIMT